MDGGRFDIDIGGWGAILSRIPIFNVRCFLGGFQEPREVEGGRGRRVEGDGGASRAIGRGRLACSGEILASEPCSSCSVALKHKLVINPLFALPLLAATCSEQSGSRGVGLWGGGSTSSQEPALVMATVARARLQSRLV